LDLVQFNAGAKNLRFKSSRGQNERNLHIINDLPACRQAGKKFILFLMDTSGAKTKSPFVKRGFVD